MDRKESDTRPLQVLAELENDERYKARNNAKWSQPADSDSGASRSVDASRLLDRLGEEMPDPRMHQESASLDQGMMAHSGYELPRYNLTDLVDESYALARRMESEVLKSSVGKKVDSRLSTSGLYRKLRRYALNIAGIHEVKPSVSSMFEQQIRLVSRLGDSLKSRTELLKETLDQADSYLVEISADLEQRSESYRQMESSDASETLKDIESALSGLTRGDPEYHKLEQYRVRVRSVVEEEEGKMSRESDRISYRTKEKAMVEALHVAVRNQLNHSLLLCQRQDQITNTVANISSIFEVAADVNNNSLQLIKELGKLKGHIESYAGLVGKTAVYAGDVLMGEAENSSLSSGFADRIRPYISDASQLNRAFNARCRKNMDLWMGGSDYKR